MIRLRELLGIFALAGAPAWCAAAEPPPGANVGGFAWLGLVTLTLLVVLVALVLWLYRRNVDASTGGAAIQVLAAQPLGPRERVVVVRIDDRILALGHTPSQVNLLAELEHFEAPAAVPLPLGSGFARQLQTLLSRGGGR